MVEKAKRTIKLRGLEKPSTIFYTPEETAISRILIDKNYVKNFNTRRKAMSANVYLKAESVHNFDLIKDLKTLNRPATSYHSSTSTRLNRTYSNISNLVKK